MTKILNILVVDDDTENADALAELFASENHKVIVAYDGNEAIEAFKTNQVDLGFFDVYLERLVQHMVESELYPQKAYVWLLREHPQPIRSVNQSILAVNVDALIGITDPRFLRCLFRRKLLLSR